MSGGDDSGGEDSGDDAPTNQRYRRHSGGDRLFHWIMAASMLVLLATGFLPVVGVDFDWVTIHWIAGCVLIAVVVIHIAHVLVKWRRLHLMFVGPRDLVDGAASLVGRGRKPGKYTVAQRLYHNGIALFVLASCITGAVMLLKIDTPWWDRDPYLIDDGWWGWIYVVHGAAALFALAMVMIHIYFAARPEKWFYTRSMVRGWITGREYRDHHDPARWPVPPRR